MTIRIVRKKNVLTSQEKDVTIKTNTILRLKSFINHENERIELHDYNRIVTKKRIINIYIKKNDRNKIEL